MGKVLDCLKCMPCKSHLEATVRVAGYSVALTAIACAIGGIASSKLRGRVKLIATVSIVVAALVAAIVAEASIKCIKCVKQKKSRRSRDEFAPDTMHTPGGSEGSFGQPSPMGQPAMMEPETVSDTAASDDEIDTVDKDNEGSDDVK